MLPTNDLKLKEMTIKSLVHVSYFEDQEIKSELLQTRIHFYLLKEDYSKFKETFFESAITLITNILLIEKDHTVSVY